MNNIGQDFNEAEFLQDIFDLVRYLDDKLREYSNALEKRKGKTLGLDITINALTILRSICIENITSVGTSGVQQTTLGALFNSVAAPSGEALSFSPKEKELLTQYEKQLPPPINSLNCKFCKKVIELDGLLEAKDDVRKRFKETGLCEECQGRVFGK